MSTADALLSSVMKPPKTVRFHRICGLAVAGMAALLWAGGAFGQSADALIDKLVEKGILTVKEANELREEADKNFSQASSVRDGMPEWVTALKFNGDFRGRFEQNNAINEQYVDRNRFRYRLRFGVTATLLNDFEVGFRLASGNPVTTSGGTLVGGLPITANTDLGSLESRKFVWIDTAYARWTPVHNGEWTVTGTIGKMDNPFLLSNMVWDYDINPEGAALTATYAPSDKHTLRAIGAFFVLDEINQGVGAVPAVDPNTDPYVVGGQIVLDSKWTPKFETSLGVAAFNIVGRSSLSSRIQPLYNSGNTRIALPADGVPISDPLAPGTLMYNFNPVIGTASGTYTLETFPLYVGKFPIRVFGELMENPAAPANNQGYRAGITMGKSGHKGTWEVTYRYQRLEADAWFDALVDDDNGAYYATNGVAYPVAPQLVGTGKANGWFGGTNVKGHFATATYSFTDFFNFTFTYYLNELLIGTPDETSKSGHFMADLMWRF